MKPLCRGKRGNLNYEPTRLATVVAWPANKTKCAEVLHHDSGVLSLSARLMAGLAILEHAFDLSDQGLRTRWIENPYF